MLPLIYGLLLLTGTFAPLLAQPTSRTEPIFLEWADSVVGSGPLESSSREFIGHVRFRQGNVTVTCDRALHNSQANSAEMFGNVVVVQDSVRLKAPRAFFDGNRNLASGSGGVVLVDRHRRLSARSGEYSTKSHIARFRDSVVARNDTLTLWSDRATYFKETGVSITTGRVVGIDSLRRAVIRGDSLYHDPRTDYVKISGDAAVWQWDSVHTESLDPADSSEQAESDTLYLIADTIEMAHQPVEQYTAVGRVDLVRGSIAARADSINHYPETGQFELYRNPCVWADSTQLHADTIKMDAPDRTVKSIVGYTNALMVTRSDTLRTNRYDQISGAQVMLLFADRELHQLIAKTSAESITWRVEDDGQPAGLARFACDTIKALLEDGTIHDVYWLENVEGEHHPEAVAGSREDSYFLPSFRWRLDKPSRPALPAPFSPAPIRIPVSDGTIKGNKMKGSEVD